MAEMVRIRRVEDYFEEFARNGIGKGADRWMIKRQMIDAFRNEIFGLVALRTKKTFDKPEDVMKEVDDKTHQVMKNIFKDELRKWKKLCDMFAMYKETRGLIELNDLTDIFEEQEKELA